MVSLPQSYSGNGFLNGLPTIVNDGGNSEFKLMADNLPNSRRGLIVRHAYVEIDEATYNRQRHYYEGTEHAWNFIEWRGRYFVIGEKAHDFKAGLPRRGRLKYERDYYGLITARCIATLYEGKVPGELNVFCGYPPADLVHNTTLMKSVLGKWSFKSFGHKISFTVKATSTFDEIIGGLMNAILNPDGYQYEAHQLIGNGNTLVVDAGGGTFDLAIVDASGKVNYSQIETYPIGGNDALERFKRLFDAKHHDMVKKKESGIGMDLVREIFLNPKHTFMREGEVIDCSDIYRDAVQPTINQYAAAIDEFSKNTLAINNVLVTGGVGGLLFDELKEQIFFNYARNNVLYQADRKNEMIYANARGADKMRAAMLNEQEKPTRKRPAGKRVKRS